MDNTDPASIAQSGIDPITGSPLSATVRKALFKRVTVSSSSFGGGGGGGALVKTQQLPDPQTLAIEQSNQQSLLLLQSQLTNLRNDISSLGSGLNRIADILQTNANQEIQKLKADQEQERRLNEQEVRVGKETELERRIQEKAIKPAEILAPKVKSIFDRIGESLSYLFLGWLTNQGIETLKALDSGSTKKLNEIKVSVLKNVGLAIVALGAIKFGFSSVIRIITGITGRIIGTLGKVALKPFEAAGNAIKGAFSGGGGKGAAAGGAEAVAKGGSEGLVSNIGKGLKGAAGAITNVAFGGLDFFQRKGEGQTNLQAGAGAASSVIGAQTGAVTGAELGSFLGPIGTVGGAVLGGAGGWMAGGGLSDILTGVNKSKEKPTKSTSTPKSAMVSSPSAAKPTTTPTVQPSQTSTTLAPKSTTQNSASEQSQTQDYSSVFKGVNLGSSSFSSDKTEKTLSSPSTTETQKPKESSMSSMMVSPMQTQKPPSPTLNVGPLPEPKTTVVVQKSGNASQQEAVPVSNDPMTDVPLISSSNPDNFYILYSQLQYNVVM